MIQQQKNSNSTSLIYIVLQIGSLNCYVQPIGIDESNI